MTVGQLEKILSTIKNKRMKVIVDKASLFDGYGSWSCCDIADAETEFVPLCDGDGFQEYRKNGQERGSVQLLLKGEV